MVYSTALWDLDLEWNWLIYLVENQIDEKKSVQLGIPASLI